MTGIHIALLALCRVRWLMAGMICVGVALLCAGEGRAEGEPSDASLTPVVLQLMWKHQFQFAGYYAAKAKGYYQRAGLDVTFVEGGLGKSGVSEVLTGKAHYAVSNPEALYQRLQGRRVVALAAIFQHSPLVLVAREETGIAHPQDLKGKRVKMTYLKRDVELHAMVIGEGIALSDMEVVDEPVRKEDFFDPAFSAVSAYVTNELYYLLQAGVQSRLLRPVNYGVDFYGDCLITSEKELKEHPHRTAAFREASLEGWKYAMDHPEEIVDLIVTTYGPDKSRDHLMYEAQAMKELIVPHLVEIGHMNPGRWQHMAEVFKTYGLVTGPLDLDGFLYDPNKPFNYALLMTSLKALIVAVFFFCLITLSLGLFTRRLKREMRVRKQAEEEKAVLIEELQGVMREMNILSGMLPICASCKKIRDDKGYWNQIETYISKHSGAQFSHGYCPECEKKVLESLDDPIED